MTGRGELVFDLDDEDEEVNEQQVNGNRLNSSTNQINNYYESDLDGPSGSDESYDPSILRRRKSKKKKTPSKRTKELQNHSISSEDTLLDQPSTSKANGVLGKRSAKRARISNTTNNSKKLKLSLPPKSTNKNASSDKDTEVGEFSNSDLSYYNFKDNTFVEKQPKFEFEQNSLIGQTVRRYENSRTSAEIRLSLRTVDNDELLSSMVKDMDDLINDNEQLHTKIETLTQRLAEFEQIGANTQGEPAPTSSEKPTGRPRTSEKSTQTLVENPNESFDSLQEGIDSFLSATNPSQNSTLSPTVQEVSPIETPNTSNTSV